MIPVLRTKAMEGKEWDLFGLSEGLIHQLLPSLWASGVFVSCAISAVAAAAQGALGVTRMGRTDEGIEEDLEKQRHNLCSLRNSG